MSVRRIGSIIAYVLLTACGGIAMGQPEGELVPIAEKRPRAPFHRNWHRATGGRVRKYEGPRGAFLAPKGTSNLAKRKPVTSSDKEPAIGRVDQITDGDKEATDGSYVELKPGVQWVQVDLERTGRLYAVIVWHCHMDVRVYRDVVVQVSDDPEFKKDVKTVFNNDHDNSAGLGFGKDLGEHELEQGHLMDAKGVEGRYVRLYSNGSTADEFNHYTEVEVFGLPVEK